MSPVVRGLPGKSKKSRREWGKYRFPGDTENMKYHDIPCSVVFVVLFLANIVLLIFGIVNGNIYAIYNSWDSQGQYCGYDNTKLEGSIENLDSSNITLTDYTGYPAAFYRATNFSVYGCTVSCPSVGSIIDVISKESESDWNSCPNGTVNYKNGSAIGCSYSTTDVFNRCIPNILDLSDTDVENFASGINQVINSIPILSSAISSIIDFYPEMLVSCIVALFISLIWVCTLRCSARFIVYTVVFLVPVVLTTIAYYLFFESKNAIAIQSIGKASLTTAQISGIVVFIVAVIVLLIIAFLFKKLYIAIDIIGIASRALGGNFAVVFVPFISLILVIVFWGIFLVSSVYNYTASSLVVSDDVIKFNPSRTILAMIFYNVAYIIFISVYIFLSNYYAISNAVVTWYFSGRKGFGFNCKCATGYYYAFTKACGTITITSLLFIPLYLFIIVMEYVQYKKSQASASCIVKFLLKCCMCCLLLFEKVVRYLTMTLLTIQQIFNRNWCISASLVVDVILADKIAVSVLNGITFFVIFLSKLVVSSLTAGLFFLYITQVKENASGWLLPTIIVFIISYIISTFILSIYEHIVDATFVCIQSEAFIPGCHTGKDNNVIEAVKEIHSKQVDGSG